MHNPIDGYRRGVTIRSIILRDLLTQDKCLLVALQLLREGLVQSISNSNILGAGLCGITAEPQD
jgi:excinuclease UvrABC helicase subunit UvrB